MKLPKNCLVEKVASQDSTRPAICLPYLDIDADRLTAHIISTNGAAMVKLPVEITPEDVTGYVPTVALKEGRKLARKFDSVDLVCNGSAKLLNGATYPRGEGQFPNWRQVWPKEEGKITLALDAALLYELAQAMGTEGVVLTFNPGEPIIVRATATKGVQPASFEARGVIMPIRIT